MRACGRSEFGRARSSGPSPSAAPNHALRDSRVMVWKATSVVGRRSRWERAWPAGESRRSLVRSREGAANSWPPLRGSVGALRLPGTQRVCSHSCARRSRSRRSRSRAAGSRPLRSTSPSLPDTGGGGRSLASEHWADACCSRKGTGQSLLRVAAIALKKDGWASSVVYSKQCRHEREERLSSTQACGRSGLARARAVLRPSPSAVPNHAARGTPSPAC